MFTYLDRYNFISAWAFFTLPYFIFYCLPIIERCIATATLNFRMMHEKIFASIFGCNKAKTFVCVEPLNSTFTHIAFSSCSGEKL